MITDDIDVEGREMFSISIISQYALDKRIILPAESSAVVFIEDNGREKGFNVLLLYLYLTII